MVLGKDFTLCDLTNNNEVGFGLPSNITDVPSPIFKLHIFYCKHCTIDEVVLLWFQDGSIKILKVTPSSELTRLSLYSLLTNTDFPTWHLIDWLHSRQPFSRHVRGNDLNSLPATGEEYFVLEVWISYFCVAGIILSILGNFQCLWRLIGEIFRFIPDMQNSALWLTLPSTDTDRITITTFWP